MCARQYYCSVVLEAEAEFRTLRTCVYRLQAWHHPGITAKDRESPYCTGSPSPDSALFDQAKHHFSSHLSPSEAQHPSILTCCRGSREQTWPHQLVIGPRLNRSKGSIPAILAIFALPQAPSAVKFVQGHGMMPAKHGNLYS